MIEIQNIRVLCAEIVEKAKSGHPGAPMGLCHMMHILYTEYLVLDLENTQNISRDIFVLSNGHACVIQYVMNHLLGLLSMEDLLSFRQLNSLTPGHPERNAHGIEITTGPLGQGVAAAVGFAISSKLYAKHISAQIPENSRVYCVFGDGCYQEGISQEAFSLCARLGLDNITFIYDYNRITIDGPAHLSMNENVIMRFEALGFAVVEADGHDSDSIRAALDSRAAGPKVIILHTTIGMDSELAGSCKAHGSPLGEENIAKLKEKYNFPEEEFRITSKLKEAYARAKNRMMASIKNRPNKNLITDKNSKISFEPYVSEDAATRKHFAKALNSIKSSQRILCGCADLTPSVLSQMNGSADFGSEDSLNVYLRFGIREHAMCGVMNGIAAHGIFLPVGGTFLNFIMYGFPSARLAALSHLRVLYVLTHDSILLGEDGPTHQPIEVLAALRAAPGLVVLRPCDGRETRAALAVAFAENGPTAVVLSRQTVPEVAATAQNENGEEYACCVSKGAYFLVKEAPSDVILLATGSEVELAFKTKELLRDKKVSIVSFVSFELFERQDAAYRQEILDAKAVKVSIEALSTFGWSKYSDLQIGLDEFGRSAPGKDAYEFFGFTPEKVAQRILDFINKRKAP